MSQLNKYLVGKQLNVALFNADFDKIQKEQVISANLIEQEKLDEINNYYKNQYIKQHTKKEGLENMTISEILIRWLSVFKEIISEILSFNYSPSEFLNIFIKEDRLFYIGITFITIGIISYLLNEFLSDEKEISNVEKIVIHNHIKGYDNSLSKNDLPNKVATELPKNGLPNKVATELPKNGLPNKIDNGLSNKIDNGLLKNGLPKELDNGLTEYGLSGN